jgi:hypothetical protein
VFINSHKAVSLHFRVTALPDGPAPASVIRQAAGCIRIFADEVGGKSTDREELTKALGHLRTATPSSSPRSTGSPAPCRTSSRSSPICAAAASASGPCGKPSPGHACLRAAAGASVLHLQRPEPLRNAGQE